jgi:hypothetical protein
VNGTVTISLADFKTLEEKAALSEKANALLVEVAADVAVILDEFERMGDMEKVANRYNEKGRNTVIKLKGDGWRLIKK